MGAVRGTAVRERFVRAKDQDKPGVAPQGGGRAGTGMLSPAPKTEPPALRAPQRHRLPWYRGPGVSLCGAAVPCRTAPPAASVLQPPPVRTTLRPHLPRAHHSAPSAGARPNRSHVGAAQQSPKAGGGWMDGRQGDRWMEGGWTMDRWMRVDRSPTAVQRLRGPMMLANGVRQRPGQEASGHPRPPPSPTPRAPPLPASPAARVHLSSTCPAVTPTGDRATPCLCPTNPAGPPPAPQTQTGVHEDHSAPPQTSRTNSFSF